MPAFDLDGYLAAVRARLDRRLAELLPPPPLDDPLRLREAIRSAVIPGGKRLRPTLTLAACEALGGAAEDALEAACAVELVHTYSLVHDDLPAMDDDDTRRGRPTTHRLYGEAPAILVGDALIAMAFEVLAADGLAVPARAAAALAAARELAQAAGPLGMVGGQARDLALKAHRGDAGFEEIERCHRGKTAALFRASAAIGAMMAGAPAADVGRLRAFGEALGLAFQHADDLADADFPRHRERAARRCQELARRAASLVEPLGDRAAPLAALAGIVMRRGREGDRRPADAPGAAHAGVAPGHA